MLPHCSGDPCLFLGEFQYLRAGVSLIALPLYFYPPCQGYFSRSQLSQQNHRRKSSQRGTCSVRHLWVRAHNVGCNGMGPLAFGYSIDNSTAITWGVTAYDIDVTKVPAKPGAHVVHFKSWTATGYARSSIQIHGFTLTSLLGAADQRVPDNDRRRFRLLHNDQRRRPIDRWQLWISYQRRRLIYR